MPKVLARLNLRDATDVLRYLNIFPFFWCIFFSSASIADWYHGNGFLGLALALSTHLFLALTFDWFHAGLRKSTRFILGKSFTTLAIDV